MADSACYDGGSIAGAVIGTFLATLLLGVILLVFWNRRKAKNNPLHDLVLVEEGDRRPGGGGGNNKNFVYDNVGFLDDTTDPKKGHQTQAPPDGAQQNQNGKMVANQESSGNKKTPWGPFSFLFSRNSRNALDDSVLEEPQRYSVALKGHDFTGLGFNICGNMRDGVYIKDVMQRGPAAESKRIMPGDRITEMTVSFKHMVLEDALTILSYASPYEVGLEMMRIPEKSLLHKGIAISSPSHAHSSGQSGPMSSTDRVCHPFFKSQSIDDLRKVGKEHLDLKVDQVMKKQVNGVKASGSADVPSVVVVPNNENRSPSIMGMGFMKSRENNASEAHQEEKQKSNKKTMSLSLDEVDTCRAPIVQEIKVSAFKPEVVPRAKSKAHNVKASVSTSTVVEAISPVIKMAYEKERMIKETAANTAQPSSPAVLHVDPLELNMPKQTVKIACADVPDGVMEHMMHLSSKAPHVEIEMMPPQVEIEMTPPQVSVQIENEIEPESQITKPERSPKKKKNEKEEDGKLKEKQKKKDKEHKEEKEEKGGEPEKSRFSKFGIRVLPDIGLGFGKKASTPEREVEKAEDKPAEKKDKDKSGKKSKGKETKEPSPIKMGSEDVSSEFQVSMTLPQQEQQQPPQTEEADEAKLKSKREEESKQQQTSDRPPSADSTGSHGEKSSKRSGFHMPNIGIKLPLFGHSKQYNLEPERDAKSTGENMSMSQIPSPSTKDEGSMPEVKVRRIEDTEIEMEMDMPRVDSPKMSPEMTIEIHETTVEVVTTTGVEGKAGGESKKGSAEPPTDEREDEKRADKEKAPGFMSKGIQSLRDFKDKVTHKLSAHDSPSSSSEGEADGDKEAGKEKGKKVKKEKEQRDRSADAKLKEKMEKEEKAREKAREKERVKAEKRAKKEELKLKKKLSASKEGLHTTDSSSSSSEESEEETQDGNKKKAKTKRSKDKGKEKKGKVKSGGKPSSLDDVDKIGSDEIELDLTHVTTQAPPKLTPAKPPVVPRKSKESLKQKDSSSEKESSKKSSKVKKAESSSSSSSSSESDTEGKDKGNKPKKPKRSTKRKAPVPPTPTAEGHMITTSVEVIQYNIDVHRHSAPEIVEATIKPKIQVDKTTMSSSTHVEPMESHRVKSPDSGRSASYGDLSTFQSIAKHKMDPLDRAASMDLTAEAGNQETHISIMSPVEDLRNVSDSTAAVLHYKPRESLDSLSSSSSSETLKASPASIVHVSPKHTHEMHAESTMQKIMEDAAMIMNKAKLKAEAEMKESNYENLSSNIFQVTQPQVTISTSGSSVLEHAEAEAIARDTVDEVLSKVNGMEARGAKDKPEKKPSKIPISKQSSLKSITVMNIQDEVKPIKVDVQMEKRTVTNVSTPPADVSVDVGANRPKLLRDDSKSRLMQTVADANDIKMSPVSPGVRKDSSGSSSSISSTSSQSSPDIRVESNPAFVETRKANGTSNLVTPPINGQTIEISANELDGIMMSHSDFLSKQASIFTPESPPKDSSFDNWVYVDQKHSQSHSTSPSEPSASSHDDDDDSGIQYSRNGALSPTTFKMETEYGASELRVTTCPPSTDSHPKQTKVYSTTMTLPQKTITQIVLSPEAGQNISVVDGNFIISKSQLETESEERNSGISNIPVLKH